MAKAQEFMLRFQAQLALLANNVHLGRKVDHYFIGLRRLGFEDYFVFCFSNRDFIEIYRIVHQSRDIEGMFENHFRKL